MSKLKSKDADSMQAAIGLILKSVEHVANRVAEVSNDTAVRNAIDVDLEKIADSCIVISKVISSFLEE